MRKEKIIRLLYVAVLVTGVWCSKKFDAPPVYTAEGVRANLTIQALRSMHFSGNFEHLTQDWVIEGMVVADDRTGNFYKSILLQDSTGGITIRMDGSGLYNDYPIGRRIAVRLNDLWLGDYAKMIQLGSGVDRSDPGSLQLLPIPSPLFDRFLVRKQLNDSLLPKQVRIEQLNDSLQSCLVRIDNTELAVSDTGKTYADAVNQTSENLAIKSCAGGSVYLRTSGFANFAGIKTPRGNGSITAVYSVFGTEKQLMIRDTPDVQFTGLRCTAAGYKLLLGEDFESGSVNTPVTLAGWKNIAETGSVYYMCKQNLGNTYAEVSAFATGQPAVVSWLITPPVNLNNSSNEILHFETKDGFDDGALLQVMVSVNYDGGTTPSKAKWTTLKSLISKGTVSGIRDGWVASGNLSLAGFSGSVYIAFRYEAGDTANANDRRTTLFQVDNLRLEGN